MGKKKIRSKTSSKGERRSIVAGVKEARRDRCPIEKAMNKIDAWKAGKNPWITVPNRGSTNQRFIRVRANELYGNPKMAMANIFKMRGEE